MNRPYGPWATQITAGQNPQLSAFWRQRLNRLPSAAAASPALTRTAVWALVATALAVGIVPTFRGQVVSAEPPDLSAKAAALLPAADSQSANGSEFRKGVAASFTAMVPVVFAEVQFFDTPPDKRKRADEEKIRQQYSAAMRAFRDQVHAHWPYSGGEDRKQQQAYADAEKEVNSLFSRAKGGEPPSIDRDEAIRRLRQIAREYHDTALSDHALDHAAYLYWDVKPRRMDEGFKLMGEVAISAAPLSADRIFALTNLASRPRDADERLHSREQFAAKMREWHDPTVLEPLLLNPLPMETEDRYVNRVDGALRNIESHYLLNATNMRTDAIIAAMKPAEARPPSPSDASKPLLAEFRQTYALADGTVIKRVAPPFSRGRLEFYHVHDPEQAKINPGGPEYMWFKWDEPIPNRLPTNWPRGREGRLDQKGMGWVGGKGPQLAWLIESWTGIHSYEMQGDRALKQTRIPGDWVVRDDVPVERLLQGLQTVLRDECKLPVRFHLGMRDRQVIVVAGTYAYRPLSGRSTVEEDHKYGYEGSELQDYDQLEIYEHDRSGLSTGHSGSLQEMLSFLTDYLDRPVIGEGIRLPADMTAGKSAKREHLLEWRLSENAMRHDKAILQGTFDEAAILKHLSEQTGLTFTQKTRRVRVLLVERAE